MTNTKIVSQKSKDLRLGLLLMIPIVLIVFIIIGIPLVRAIYWSFTDKIVGNDATFIGLKNYSALLKDKVYWKSLKNTAICFLDCYGRCY